MEAGQNGPAEVMFDARPFGVHRHVEEAGEEAEDNEAGEEEQGRRRNQQRRGRQALEGNDGEQNSAQREAAAEQSAARHSDEIGDSEEGHRHPEDGRRHADVLRYARRGAGPKAQSQTQCEKHRSYGVMGRQQRASRREGVSDDERLRIHARETAPATSWGHLRAKSALLAEGAHSLQGLREESSPCGALSIINRP
jgi:hypothetical protein